jgi:hypothetical protein
MHTLSGDGDHERGRLARTHEDVLQRLQKEGVIRGDETSFKSYKQ